ncbi:MAG: VOC family protein [Chloroflexi bacterium]|nr:VOC family protein [Chloroflexota bacterium]
MASYRQDHIHVTNPDPAKAADFYVKVMGARFIRERGLPGRQIMELDLGGIPLRISNSTGADENWKGLQLGLHHLGLTVDDMDKAVAEMSSKGVEFVVKPHSPRPGVKAAFIKTPDGVLFELMEKKEG